MKFLIISDLHFKETNDWEFINKITQSMVNIVKRKIKDSEELLVIILGDIIDCGGIGNIDYKFTQADIFIKSLKKELRNSKFLFIPGNHEIVGEKQELASFNAFCERHSYKNDIQFTQESSVYALEEAGVNLILADTTLNRRHDSDGNVDTQAIVENLSRRKNLIFMHHPPCKIQGADRSVVNSKELISTRSNFIFYGHQHGGAVIADFLEGDTDIHAVGTLLKQEKGAKHEFLLLDILDGKFNFAYRYTYNGSRFIPNILFPKKVELKSHNLYLSSPNIVETKVSRKFKFISDSYDNTENNDSIWIKYVGEDIDIALKKHNKLLIIGDAGVGKSYELAVIYDSLKNDEDYFPLWINVRNTNYSILQQYIWYAQHNTIDRKLPFLVIDGLDEMDGDKISTFIKDIGTATYGNPEIKIIISVRRNFKISLDGFAEYKVLPLSTDQIKEIAAQKGIGNIKAFIDCLNNSGCLSLAEIPFYLIDIIQLYIESGTLPKRDKLLDRIISFRFKKGDDKYSVEPMKKLMSNEYDLRQWLKELSFFMQSQHMYSINNISYTQYFTADKREFFDRTGLVSCKGSEHTLNWEFEHNIFREYFAATYICNLSFDELLELITFDSEYKKLRPSWINTVSFVLALRKEDDLKSWLIDNAKDILIQFETDRLSEDERNQIFVLVMEDSFKTEIPVYASYDVAKLAQYFQSKQTLDYLIDILSKSCGKSSVLSSLKILSNFTSFFDEEIDLKEVILQYVNCETQEYIVSCAISALVNISSSESLDLLEDIFSLIENDNRPDVVGAICKLIVKAQVADKYADYILDKLNRIGIYDDRLDIPRIIDQAARTFFKTETIVKVLDWLSNAQKTSIHYKYNELFERLVFNALKVNNVHEFFDSFVRILITASAKRDRRKTEILKHFFVETETLNGAFKLLLKSKLPYNVKMLTVEDMMDETLTEILIESYVNNEVESEVYKWYAKRLPEDSAIFIQLNTATLKKEGCKIQQEEKVDWEKVQRQSQQIYFDSLFNKKSFSALINEILGFVGENIKCNELFDEAFSKIPQNREDLQNVLGSVYRWGAENCLVSNFKNLIEWDIFSISEICDVLKDKEQVNITYEQENFMRDYYNNKLEIVDFERLDESNPKHKMLFWHAEKVVFLMEKLNFPCSDEKLLEMLMLPCYVFESSTVNSQSETLEFISQKISKPNKLQEKILNNVNTKVLSPSATHTHILYCLEHSLPYAAKIAEEIFKSKDANTKWVKNTAIDYLIAIKGDKYVNELIEKLDSPDADLLNYLAYKMKSNNNCLIAKLITGNENSADHKLHLDNLIRLNTRYGLEKYIELVKKENTLPDISEDKHVICGITEAIREISNIELIDCIRELLVICYSKNFVDNEIFGLRGSLGNAVNRLMQADAKKVKETMISLIEQHSDNKDLVSICNWYLKDAERLLNTSSDLPWEIEKTLRFIKHHQPIKIW